MRVIKKIVRYPIKGLPGEFLEYVNLISNAVIPGDRKFAIARNETIINEFSLEFMKKTNFLALVKDEKLALLKLSLDLKSEYLKLYLENKECFSGFLNNEKDLNTLSHFLCVFLNMDVNKRPKLVRDKSTKKEILKHSFSDIPDKAISLINFETIKDFEKKIGKKIDFLRFRGNFNFFGVQPWEEFDWIDKKIKIGTAKFKVFRKTQRCRATTVNPDNGLRDINIPFELNKHYGHFDLGVYCKVVTNGNVKIDDEIQIIN